MSSPTPPSANNPIDRPDLPQSPPGSYAAGAGYGSGESGRTDTSSNAAVDTTRGNGEFTEKAEQLSREAMAKAQSVKSAVSHRVGAVADRLRSRANGGRLSGAANSVASGLERAGAYFDDHDLSNVGDSMTNTIRRYPLQATVVGLGVGFLLGRSLSRRTM